MGDEERRIVDEMVAEWASEAEYDLGAARDNVDAGRYKTAALCSQQAAEKLLKALVISRTGQEAARTHDLIALAKELGAPESLMEACRFLTQEYFEARYPGSAAFLGHGKYDRDIADERLRQATDIAEWVREQLGYRDQNDS
jgi:HEPN domain-containing protein